MGVGGDGRRWEDEEARRRAGTSSPGPGNWCGRFPGSGDTPAKKEKNKDRTGRISSHKTGVTTDYKRRRGKGGKQKAGN